VCSSLGNAGINILAIAQGSSQRNISIVIKASDQQEAVQVVHNAFYSYLIEKPRVVLALIGPGNVGSALLKQIASYNSRFPINPIHVKAIVRSKRMYIGETPLDISKWEENFEKYAIPTDLTKVEEVLSREKLISSIAFVDCTSSEQTASKYLHWLKYGFNIVGANKKFFSGSITDYEALKIALGERDVQCFYEATVGAGLPVMGPLRNMDKTGDKIQKIEGVFSGTLSYLFNQFRLGEKKFSEIVYDAVKLGYTEPDPRDDLSAMDFARKLVILSRECGVPLSLNEINIHSLVEKDLENVTVREFLDKLPNYDHKMDKLQEEAKKNGKVLCFVGEVDAIKKTAQLSLQQLSPTHPLATLSGTENMISFNTEWYKYPLIVRGPGAGPQVTAAGVLGDILNLNYK
jgi:aspartokinase/homoserine dehydrogenase 1